MNLSRSSELSLTTGATPIVIGRKIIGKLLSSSNFHLSLFQNTCRIFCNSFDVAFDKIGFGAILKAGQPGHQRNSETFSSERLPSSCNGTSALCTWRNSHSQFDSTTAPRLGFARRAVECKKLDPDAPVETNGPVRRETAKETNAGDLRNISTRRSTRGQGFIVFPYQDQDLFPPVSLSSLL